MRQAMRLISTTVLIGVIGVGAAQAWTCTLPAGTINGTSSSVDWSGFKGGGKASDFGRKLTDGAASSNGRPTSRCQPLANVNSELADVRARQFGTTAAQMFTDAVACETASDRVVIVYVLSPDHKIDYQGSRDFSGLVELYGKGYFGVDCRQ